jgi:hypothetical protein
VHVVAAFQDSAAADEADAGDESLEDARLLRRARAEELAGEQDEPATGDGDDGKGAQSGAACLALAVLSERKREGEGEGESHDVIGYVPPDAPVRTHDPSPV